VTPSGVSRGSKRGTAHRSDRLPLGGRLLAACQTTRWTLLAGPTLSEADIANEIEIILLPYSENKEFRYMAQRFRLRGGCIPDHHNTSRSDEGVNEPCTSHR
jgi:hypothetical protein